MKRKHFNIQFGDEVRIESDDMLLTGNSLLLYRLAVIISGLAIQNTYVENTFLFGIKDSVRIVDFYVYEELFKKICSSLTISH